MQVLEEFLKHHDTSPGPLFCHRDGSPLTKYQFGAVMSKALKGAGISGWKFGTHSFRTGAASTAAALGYSEEQIICVGCRSSRAYKAYVRQLPQ